MKVIRQVNISSNIFTLWYNIYGIYQMPHVSAIITKVYMLKCWLIYLYSSGSSDRMQPTSFVRRYHWISLQEIILLIRHKKSHQFEHQISHDLGWMLFIFNAEERTVLKIGQDKISGQIMMQISVRFSVFCYTYYSYCFKHLSHKYWCCSRSINLQYDFEPWSPVLKGTKVHLGWN